MLHSKRQLICNNKTGKRAPFGCLCKYAHVVVTLTEQEVEMLSIYVQKCRPQTKPLVQNVFVS